MAHWVEMFIPIFLALVRYILAVVFLVASLGKIREPGSFIKTVAGYRLLPSFVVRPFGLLLPWIEFALGVILLIGWETRLASVATCLLYLMFIGALTINLARGRKDLDCGCFGSKHKHEIDRGLIIRDILLLLGAGLILYFGGGIFAFDNLATEAQSVLIHVMVNFLLPSILIVIGLYMSFVLFKQTLRLIYISSKE